MGESGQDRDYLTVRAPTPDWFDWAIGRPRESRVITVDDCPIHYLLWPADDPGADRRGLLFVHGGGAHAHWWSFIAPYFTRDFQVAAIDLAGMGDSGRRTSYGAEQRATEIRAVIADADLGARPFVVGHSFGGLMAMKFAAERHAAIDGAVFVDAPVRSPEEQRTRPLRPPRAGRKRIYESFDRALARFRLMPEQECENDYIVEHIARHSIAAVDGGWSWKFDPIAMAPRRFQEPFDRHLAEVGCRAAMIYGEQSALVSPDTVAYMCSLLGPGSPVIGIPGARHHVTLDAPLAFVDALGDILTGWAQAR